MAMAEDGTLLQISGREGSNYELISRLLASGTYYLRVYDVESSATNYSPEKRLAI